MKPNAAQIIALLPDLSKADLAAVKGAADSLLGAQATAIDQAATPLFTVITRALSLKRGFAAFHATAAHKQFKRGAAAIDAFVAEAFPNLGQRSKQALLSLIVDCLLDDLKRMKIPLSLGTVCGNLERAPQVLRDAFPGYLESGHGRFILEHLTRKQ